jgi:hypothetical protein
VILVVVGAGTSSALRLVLGGHTFRGWLFVELRRLMTHSSTPGLWKEEGSVFYHHLCSGGYPLCFLRTVFQEVQSELLKGVARRKTASFCVLTLRNAPEWPMLKELLDLSLSELTESTFGDIVPERVFLAQSSAPRLGSESILKR